MPDTLNMSHTPPASDSSIASKVAVVTGATGIMGPCICATLRADGWRVAACDLSARHFKRSLAIEHLAPIPRDAEFYADLSDPLACGRMIAEIEATLGPVSLLVNNAIDGTLKGTLPEIDPGHFSKLMNLTLGAPLFLTQAALPSLIRNKGSVVMISSVRVHTFATGSLLYSVAKSAVEKLTETLACELSDQGVRVNCIRVGSVPGWAFMQPVLEKLTAEQAERLCDEVLPDHLQGHGKDVGVRRQGVPMDVAMAVRFLSSVDAGFIHGAILPVDGGLGFRRRSSAEATALYARSLERVREWLVREGLDHLLGEIEGGIK